MQNCRMRYNLFIWPRSLRCCSYVVSENTCAYALHRLTAQSESFQSTMLWLCKGLVIDSLSNESLSEVRDYSKYLQQCSPTVTAATFPNFRESDIHGNNIVSILFFLPIAKVLLGKNWWVWLLMPRSLFNGGTWWVFYFEFTKVSLIEFPDLFSNTEMST